MREVKKQVGKLREENALERLWQLNQWVRTTRPEQHVAEDDGEPIRKVAGGPRPK